MKTSKNKTSKAKARNKRAAAETKTTPAVKQGKPSAKAATGVRAKAARRTAEGKFAKIIFNQIGGKECSRFAAMTWKERDAVMAKPENAVVRERYEAHLASLKAAIKA
jgi:muramoyltetrapeptide carboxypeptidase LdcA involved in peptidoglycan recycling